MLGEWTVGELFGTVRSPRLPLVTVTAGMHFYCVCVYALCGVYMFVCFVVFKALCVLFVCVSVLCICGFVCVRMFVVCLLKVICMQFLNKKMITIASDICVHNVIAHKQYSFFLFFVPFFFPH